MAALPTVMIVASAALSAAQTIMGAQEAKAQAENQAAMARYQASLDEQNAQKERAEAARAEADVRRISSNERARQRALMAEGGVLESASSQGVLNQKANLDELEALDIRYQGDVKSQGLLADSQVSRNAAIIADRKAKKAQTDGMFNLGHKAISTINKF